VLELSFVTSFLYKSFENLEVAIIDSPVIENPVVIDKKVRICGKVEELSKYKYVENKNVIPTKKMYFIILLIVSIYFLFYFCNYSNENFTWTKHFIFVNRGFNVDFSSE